MQRRVFKFKDFLFGGDNFVYFVNCELCEIWGVGGEVSARSSININNI